MSSIIKLLMRSLLILVVLMLSSCDNSLPVDPYEQMLRISTQVAATPDLSLTSNTISRTPNGTIYLATGLDNPALKVDMNGSVTKLPIHSYNVTKNSSGQVFFTVGAGIAEAADDGSIHMLAGTNDSVVDNKPGMNGVDGPVNEAKFDSEDLTLIASDQLGNVYLANSPSSPTISVRKIGIDGKVITLLKNQKIREKTSNWGWSNFVADSKGNLYFGGAYAVIKVDPTGIVQTYAGDESKNGLSKDGVGGDAGFETINSLKIDSHDNIYVQSHSQIRKISPDRNVTTIYADSLTNQLNKNIKPSLQGCTSLDWKSAKLDGCITGLVDGSINKQILHIDSFDVDNEGNIYFIDTKVNALRELSNQGILSTIVRGKFPEHCFDLGCTKRAKG